MKKLLPLLFLGLGLGLTGTAHAQSKPKQAKRVFAHNSVSGRGKTDRAQFRRENKDKLPILDLGRGKPEKFRTARANPPYKFPNPHK